MLNGYSFIINEKSNIVTYKAKTTELIIDISGYEYVLDYFKEIEGYNMRLWKSINLYLSII